MTIKSDNVAAKPAAAKKRTLKPGMGKAKGNSFENTVAKKLATGLSPLKFIRTPGSGARVGGKNFEIFGKMFGEEALKIFVGDVVPINEKESNVKFNFSVECKFYKTADNFPSLVSKSANVFKWMRESITDATKIDKVPLLIFKWNHTPIFVACISKQIAHAPQLTLTQDELTIDIFYLDDLLKNKNLWITEL